ncbi:unnamed protein product [Protopolystoma xenopodis]|uniref:Uncharacterized protein n=1 Tax=Protopolystoma xenopodis TaxID=117903 RepID=A0A3S5B3X5_9PLAT|nr:unnamed protein product [Protopolystoma xenopodis]
MRSYRRRITTTGVGGGIGSSSLSCGGRVGGTISGSNLVLSRRLANSQTHAQGQGLLATSSATLPAWSGQASGQLGMVSGYTSTPSADFSLGLGLDVPMSEASQHPRYLVKSNVSITEPESSSAIGSAGCSGQISEPNGGFIRGVGSQIYKQDENRAMVTATYMLGPATSDTCTLNCSRSPHPQSPSRSRSKSHSHSRSRSRSASNSSAEKRKALVDSNSMNTDLTAESIHSSIGLSGGLICAAATAPLANRQKYYLVQSAGGHLAASSDREPIHLVRLPAGASGQQLLLRPMVPSSNLVSVGQQSQKPQQPHQVVMIQQAINNRSGLSNPNIGQTPSLLMLPADPYSMMHASLLVPSHAGPTSCSWLAGQVAGLDAASSSHTLPPLPIPSSPPLPASTQSPIQTKTSEPAVLQALTPGQVQQLLQLQQQQQHQQQFKLQQQGRFRNVHTIGPHSLISEWTSIHTA